MNFDEVIAEANALAAKVETPKCDVSEAELKAAVLKMGRVGYAMSKKSLEALKAYLECKPLILAGHVGTGKTLFFGALEKAGLAAGKIVVRNIKALGNASFDEIMDEIESYADAEIVIDDLGSEHDKVEYGNKLDLIASIIEVRNQTSRKRTHYTTNLTMKELKERYGDRVFSRLKTCQSMAFLSPDMRTVTVNADAVALRKKIHDSKSWELCAERCKNCKGTSCGAGVKIPYGAETNKKPPEECPFFDGEIKEPLPKSENSPHWMQYCERVGKPVDPN